MTVSVSKLGDVAEFVNGAAFKPEDWCGTGSKIIRIQNLTDPSKPYNRTTREVSDRLYVQQGDLLVSWSATLGVFQWDDPEIGVLNQHIFRVIPDLAKINKRYLRHALQVALLDMRKHLHGATMLHVNRGEFLATALFLPPLPEQRRIAAILDQADALRAKRREALAQLDSLTQSIFIEMFGDPVENPNGWQPVQLSDVSDIVTGFAFKSEEYVDGSSSSIKLCRGANVMPGRLDWSDLASWPASKIEQISAFQLQAGDIVMAMDRPWISEGFKVAQVSKNDCPSLLVQRVARLRGIGEVSNDYIYHLLNHPVFTAHCRPTETTIPHISPREIRSFRFHLPPVHLQRNFVNRVSCLNNLKSSQVESLKELDALFASLQHRAFQGEL